MPNGFNNSRGRDGGRDGGRNERRERGGGRRWDDKGGGRRDDDRGGGRGGGRRWYDRKSRYPKFYLPPYFYRYPRRRCVWYDRYGRCCDRYGRCCDRYGRCEYYDGYKNNRYLPMADYEQDSDWNSETASQSMIEAPVDESEY